VRSASSGPASRSSQSVSIAASMIIIPGRLRDIMKVSCGGGFGAAVSLYGATIYG